jgi:chromosome partitioning protein
MKRIIVIANQKGGVGKSTLSILLANYLAWKEQKVLLIDADIQRSVTTMRKNDKEFFGVEPPYDVIPIDIENPAKVKKVINNIEFDGTIIIDCPGNVRDEGLVSIFSAASMIVIPFEYEKISLEATTDFVALLNTIKQEMRFQANYLFIPNRVQANVGTSSEIALWRQCASMFNMVGQLLPRIPNRAILKRIDTYEITPAQRGLAGGVLEGILKAMEL